MVVVGVVMGMRWMFCDNGSGFEGWLFVGWASVLKVAGAWNRLSLHLTKI